MGCVFLCVCIPVAPFICRLGGRQVVCFSGGLLAAVPGCREKDSFVFCIVYIMSGMVYGVSTSIGNKRDMC